MKDGTYDTSIYADYSLINSSQGICIPTTAAPLSACQTEQLPFQRTIRKESLDSGTAVRICEQYIQKARKAAALLNVSIADETYQLIFNSCIYDTETTGDKMVCPTIHLPKLRQKSCFFLDCGKIGSNSIRVLLNEGINNLPPLTDIQFEEYMQKSIILVDEAIISANYAIDDVIEQGYYAKTRNYILY